MPKELLSARGLESALKAATVQADAKQTRVKIRDGDNLILIVRPGGGASWVLQYRLDGQRKALTLGAWPAVGLKLARELAAAARTQVAQGIDPVQARAEEAARKAAVRRGATFRAVFTDWLALQRISEVYRGNIEAAFLKDVLPAIGAKPPRLVTRQDIMGILRGMADRGALVMLRRVRMWLRQCFEYAIDAGEVEASPVPTGHLKAFAEPDAQHLPAITDPAEVPALLRAIDAYPSPVVRTLLQLSAYVWQRPTEIRAARWEEFDLAAARWVIPAGRMKLKREHWVPLATQVVQLLQRHQGLAGDDGLLFPGHRMGKALSEAAAGAALESLGYKGRHTPHGFRAMARTILEERLQAPAKVLEKQLAHEQGDKVARAYNRAEYWQERVQVMQLWADWLDQQRRG